MTRLLAPLRIPALALASFALLGAEVQCADAAAGPRPSLSALQAQVDALAGRVDALETQNATLVARVAALESEDAGQLARIAELEATLACVSATPTQFVFEDCNVHVRNGLGGTHGTPNGLGNLVVGYDEGTGSKSGSHNLVVGGGHAYPSTGGVVFGARNTVSFPRAVVAGGSDIVINWPDGWHAPGLHHGPGSLQIGTAGSDLEMTGTTVEIQGDIMVSIDGGAQTLIDGSILRLNGGANPAAAVGDTVTLSPGSGTISTGAPTVLIP